MRPTRRPAADLFVPKLLGERKYKAEELWLAGKAAA